MILVFFIRLYQRCLSPLLPPACRFYPSCSDYCIAAVQQHGLRRGGWIGLKRLLRCHPGTPGGHDPIPPCDDSPCDDSPLSGRASSGASPLR